MTVNRQTTRLFCLMMSLQQTDYLNSFFDELSLQFDCPSHKLGEIVAMLSPAFLLCWLYSSELEGDCHDVEEVPQIGPHVHDEVLAAIVKRDEKVEDLLIHCALITSVP